MKISDYKEKVFDLGDTWQCECGKKHKLSGGYLAAHWSIRLLHKCECGRKHSLCSGRIDLVRKSK